MQRISKTVSSYLANELGHNEEKEEIIAYAVESLLLGVVGLILIMIVGYILGAFKETLCAAVAGGVLRKCSGGAHCSTRVRCMTIGAVMYPLVGLSAKKILLLLDIMRINQEVLIASGVISFLIVLLYAPVDSPSKPIISDSFRKKLHCSSLIVVVVLWGSSFLFLSGSLALAIVFGLIIQSFSLLPIFN